MILKFGVLVLLILAFAVACSKEGRSGWFLDPTFSLQLVSFSEFYTLRTKQDPADTVDVLQIFKANKGKDSLFNVDDIRSRAWVYETTRREDIAAFFRAARKTLPSNIYCKISDSGVVYLVLAFDRDLMRVGYLKYYPCASEDLGYLTLYGTNSAYFSSDLAKIIGAIMGAELHTPESSAGGLGS
ncbi:MAG: hypothetical protein HY694_07450 [Deltaproteobacteria bacterium]|nr:hypothetical protein [Deltaproteobacteria bacterium]